MGGGGGRGREDGRGEERGGEGKRGGDRGVEEEWERCGKGRKDRKRRMKRRERVTEANRWISIFQLIIKNKKDVRVVV